METVSLLFFLLKPWLCFCIFICRSGLDGNSQNLGTFLFGSAGLPELEAVRGAVRRSQHHVGHPLQAADAREPKIPHGGTERADQHSRCQDAFCFFFFFFLLYLRPFVSCLCQAGREEEAIYVFRLMFHMNNKGKDKSFPVRSRLSLNTM